MHAQGNICKQALSIGMRSLHMNVDYTHSSTGTEYTSVVFRLYDIPSISFSDLISTPLDITNSHYTITTLAIDTSPKAMISLVGSFKSCHPVLVRSPSTTSTPMSTASLRPSILSAEHLVAKHVFFRKEPGKGHHRFSTEDELAKTLDEANCLYWGAALMGMAYTFVDQMLKTGKVQKDVEKLVPRLRLVRAALVIPVDIDDSDSHANYLIEERISGTFVKYINNNSAVPARILDSKEAEIGLFLCFVQHIQYRLSNEMVYLSDFQG